MKRLARLLLRFFVVAVPVFIAACYGVAYNFTRRGKVVDKDSKKGLFGVTVTCDHKDGTKELPANTDVDGRFLLDFNKPCDTVTASQEPTDGPAAYQKTTIPFVDDGSDLLIEMPKR